MEKFKSYSFWVGLIASIMLVVKFIAESFGFSIPEDSINSIVNGVLGILCVIGVINKPTKLDNKEENVDIKNNNVDDEI